MQSLSRSLMPGVLLLASLGAGRETAAQISEVGDSNQGKIFFRQNCVLCHADGPGTGSTVIVKQGPSLVGVFGRRAGFGPNFNYTKALSESGLTWDSATLDHFLASPMTSLPGTTMPISVPNAGDRLNLIAYLSTLKVPVEASPSAAPAQPQAATPARPDRSGKAWPR